MVLDLPSKNCKRSRHKFWLKHSKLRYSYFLNHFRKTPMESCHLFWNAFSTVDAQKALSVSLLFLWRNSILRSNSLGVLYRNTVTLKRSGEFALSTLKVVRSSLSLISHFSHSCQNITLFPPHIHIFLHFLFHLCSNSLHLRFLSQIYNWLGKKKPQKQTLYSSPGFVKMNTMFCLWHQPVPQRPNLSS